jgi:hypothetical protein
MNNKTIISGTATIVGSILFSAYWVGKQYSRFSLIIEGFKENQKALEKKIDDAEGRQSKAITEAEVRQSKAITDSKKDLMSMLKTYSELNKVFFFFFILFPLIQFKKRNKWNI